MDINLVAVSGTVSALLMILGGFVLLAGALLFLTGYLEGLQRSALGAPLRLERDEDDAACMEVLTRKIAAWNCPSGSASGH